MLQESDDDEMSGAELPASVADEEESDEDVDDDEDEDEDDEEEEDDDEEEGEEDEVEKKTSVTVKMVRQWQEGMIKVSFSLSLRFNLRIG